MRFTVLFTTLLLLSSTAMANQAYIQARAWQVDKLPIMKGQSPHQRCLLQTGFSGTASMQYIVEGRQLRGAIFIVTEPVFKEAGRSIDVSLIVGKQAFEFPARTISKYSVAVEISDAYERQFRKALENAQHVELKSGFDSYSFSIKPVTQSLEDALACTPVKPVALEPSPAMRQTLEKIAAMPTEELKASTEPSGAMPEPTPAPMTTPTPTPQMATTADDAPRQNVVIGGAKSKPNEGEAHFVRNGGTNVSLEDALPMILPPQYKVNYAQGATAGTRVSFPAGGDWLETLVVALDDVGLQGAVTGKTVTILPKIRPVQMEVTSVLPTQRSDVIVKEPGGATMLVSDPSKPLSPGMLSEADLMLANLRQLDENELWAATTDKPNKMQPIADNGDTIPMPGKPDVKVDTVVSVKKQGEDVPPETAMPATVLAAKPEAAIYTAKKGETVREVLDRWGKQSGAETQVDLKREYYVGRDIKVAGDVDTAVEQLMGQFSDLAQPLRRDGEVAVDAGSGVDTGGASGSVKGGPVIGASGAVASMDEMPPAAPVAQLPQGPNEVEQRLGLVSSWSAVQGTSLRAALSNWARQSQMQLVWEAAEDMQVATNVSGARRLEDALDGLLASYDSAAQKPSVSINRDPNTGRIAMIVDIQPFAMEAKDPAEKPAKSTSKKAK